jgi:hypothetical protein
LEIHAHKADHSKGNNSNVKKLPLHVTVAIVSLILGYVAADAVAYYFAKAHGVMKFGGIFRKQPPEPIP